MKRRKKDRNYLLTSESVTEGHPDKMADKISDSILDEMIKQDEHSKVACETVLTENLAFITGEVNPPPAFEVEDIVRETIEEIGYTNIDYGFDAGSCEIDTVLSSQSEDIKRGVEKEDQGAGDQGIMYGYATDETEEMMPLPIVLAHKLARKLAEARKKKEIEYLRPDGKSQVTVEYEGTEAKRIEDVVIAAQRAPSVEKEKLREDIKEEIISPVCGEMIDDETTFKINETGRFVDGGPRADTGLTGRKIIVDSYGGHGSHGGGCFSGKDPSKVDRSGAYMARYIAKNIVAAGLAKKVEVQLSYAIGVAEPTSLLINTYGTNGVGEKEIEERVKEKFPLKPAEIIARLDLLRPIYERTATYGHFGRNESGFSWEKTDIAEKL